ncbi:MAG: serine/threonine protein kinase, partial [Planctomycetaceae bacterium]|nr:serine/threonine protein kinase [Planctomycetaceae bacterium]
PDQPDPPDPPDPIVPQPSFDLAATGSYVPSVHEKLEKLIPGNVLGDNFRLEFQLGRGGMGEVWKAYDLTADRFVVLKFVPKEIQHVQEAMDGVRDSFKKVHALQHKHICPVYGLFADPQHGYYLVMKYIDGMSLDEYRRKQIEKQGRMSSTDAVQILWAVARGLDYAHEMKVIHRDIKPQNIMIGKKDGVQIIDFGLAEEIRTSMAQVSEAAMGIVGTRPYMAPEQWMGRFQDARTDQYALAVTAYELLAGRLPFMDSKVGLLRERVLNDKPEPVPKYPAYINAALFKALAKKREDRFPNCKSFVRALVKPKAETAETPLSVVPALPADEDVGQMTPPLWLSSGKEDSVTKKSGSVRFGFQNPKSRIVGFGIAAFCALLLVLLGLFLALK